MDVTNKHWGEVFSSFALAIVAVFAVGCTPIFGPVPSAYPFQDLEQEILDVADRSYEEGDTSALYALERRIMGWDIVPQEENARAYWLAFLNFNLARIEEHSGDSEQSLLRIDRALEQINSLDESNVETQALKAILVKSKIPLAPDDTFELLMDMQDVLNTALNLDERNLRAQLAAAMDAVIEVPGFGGGIDANDILEAALAMDPYQTDNVGTVFDHPPTWGRAEVLALKVIHLRDSGRPNEARESLESALEEFPNHFVLKMLDTEEPE